MYSVVLKLLWLDSVNYVAALSTEKIIGRWQFWCVALPTVSYI